MLRSTSTELAIEVHSVEGGFGVNTPCEMGLVAACQGVFSLLLSPVHGGGGADLLLGV